MAKFNPFNANNKKLTSGILDKIIADAPLVAKRKDGLDVQIQDATTLLSHLGMEQAVALLKNYPRNKPIIEEEGHSSISKLINSTSSIATRKDSLCRQIDDAIKLLSKLGMQDARDLLEDFLTDNKDSRTWKYLKEPVE